MAWSLLLTKGIPFESVLQECARSSDVVGWFNRIYGCDLKLPIEALEDSGFLDWCDRASTSQVDEQIDTFVGFVLTNFWVPYKDAAIARNEIHLNRSTRPSSSPSPPVTDRSGKLSRH